jgi:hypothetical protein
MDGGHYGKEFICYEVLEYSGKREGNAILICMEPFFHINVLTLRCFSPFLNSAIVVWEVRR